MLSPRLRFISILLLLSIFELGLAIAVLFMPLPNLNLVEFVYSQLGETGVTYPLTAILFHYRSYDTLLGLCLLFVALLGTWTVYYTTVLPHKTLSHFDTPLMQPLPGLILLAIFLLAAGYIVWMGGYIPASAFQIGALLAGIGVLLRVINIIQAQPIVEKTSFLLRIGLGGGLLVFACIALAVMAEGYQLLQYPEKLANNLILLIEIALTISIGLILLMFFIATPGIKRVTVITDN